MSTSDWRWEVQIRGHLSDLEHLASYFTSTNFSVFRDERDGSYFYCSKEFESCDTSEKVFAIANDNLAVLSGVLKFVRESFEPLITGTVHKHHADGKREQFLHMRECFQNRNEFFEATIAVADPHGNIVQQPPHPPRTISIFALTPQDTAVTKVMRLFAAPDAKTWVGLFRIYEVIEAEVGSQQLKKKNWGSRTDLKRFKHSANSVKVGGDMARHGKENSVPPSNPMTVEEAFAYVNYLMHAWLASKGV
ncbi:MAG: hypothetical protein ACXV7F_06270 [Methylomonas sp.]